MARYRYYTADLLTGNVLAELPFYGVFLERKLSTTGSFNGTLRLGTGRNDTEMVDGVAPGRTALYVERDDTLIWGGIIWTRTYQANSKTLQITAQTFESYFDHVILQQDFVKQNIGQYQIFLDLINTLQAQELCDIDLDVSLIDPTGPSNTPRTVLIPGYEYRYAQEVVRQLVGVQGGFDYTIGVIPSNIQDKPRKLVRVGYPLLGGDAQSSNLTFDYPGNIKTYWWPENASSAGTRFVGLGAGSGSSMISAEVRNDVLLNAGYPSWWIIKSHKDLGTLNEVIKATEGIRDRYSIPVSSPTFEIKPDRIPPFDAWSALGSYFEAYIEDVRFPQGKSVLSRMIGWELTPASASGLETLKFIIEGLEGSNNA